MQWSPHSNVRQQGLFNFPDAAPFHGAALPCHPIFPQRARAHGARSRKFWAPLRGAGSLVRPRRMPCRAAAKQPALQGFVDSARCVAAK